MTERLIRFGSPPLAGVLTEPAEGVRAGPAIVLCGAGMLARVGPNRLHVDLARALAARGFPALRFDFSGVGDSPLRRDLLPAEDYTVAEARAAGDWLERNLGAHRLLVFGVCSGAEVALRVAAADPRVAGAVLVNPLFFAPGGPAEGALAGSRARAGMKGYAGRVLEARAWRNLLAGRTDLRAAGRTLAAALLPGRARRARAAQFRLDTAPLKDGRVPFLVIFGDRAPQWVAVRLVVRPGLQSGPAAPTICALPGADHVLTPRRCRAALIGLVLEWAQQRS